ncbi:cobalt chelatase [Alcaligenaceae bacterium]|nr:cobalt chelatase [Alcaligenaceae bacterium]
MSRRQQQLEELCVASARALTGDPGLYYRNSMLYRDNAPVRVRAPHLRVNAAQRNLTTLRGINDALALRLVHSDTALFKQMQPEEPVQRLIFDLLEQLRVEALAPASLPGTGVNVRRRFLDWSHEFYVSGLADSALGLLLFTVAQMAWSRLNALPVFAEAEDFIEATRAGIAPVIGGALAGLRRNRHDQASYAPHALELARLVFQSVQDAGKADGEDDNAETSGAYNGFALLLDFEEEPESVPQAPSGVSRVFHESDSIYRVYTTQFDVEVDAVTQVRPELLREYRDELDRLVTAQGYSRARLLRLLSASLLAPRIDGRLYGEEEGLIDGRRLASLVASPAERRLFTLDRTVLHAQCMVTVLIDCSASMKGQVHPVAVLIDTLVRALDSLGVVTEVLGFTTGGWNGGRAYKEWLRRGRPPTPGRLNEITHRVFKHAEQSWRQSRTGIAALFKPDLFREGIDGEAVQWATERMRGRDEPRRILVVLSDGCPMDGATTVANDEFYLDNHLRQTVQNLEREGSVEVLGIGVGLDLSAFYRRCLAVNISNGLDNEVIYEVARMLHPRWRPV